MGIFIFFFGIVLPFRGSSAIIKGQNAPIVMGGRISEYRFRLIHGGGFYFALYFPTVTAILAHSIGNSLVLLAEHQRHDNNKSQNSYGERNV